MEISKTEQENIKIIFKQEVKIKALEKENTELKLLLEEKNEPLTAVQKTIRDHITYCLREYSQYPPEDINIGIQELRKLENLVKIKELFIT